jgi:hypothetical protein
MASRLPSQDIDELAQWIHSRFGGDIDDLRARANSLQTFFQMLLHIADDPDAVQPLIDNLAAQTPNTDGVAREGLARHALWLLLFSRIRRGAISRHEPTARDGRSQPGYSISSLHPPRALADKK